MPADSLLWILVGLALGVTLSMGLLMVYAAFERRAIARRSVAPPNGKIPRCTSFWANRVVLAHRLMSAASISSMPMVRQ